MKKINKKLIFGIIMFVIVGAIFLYFDKPSETKAEWWNDSWQFRKALTINHNQVAGDLENFPVLVSFTDSNLSGHAQEDGDDFVFVDSEGKTLNHEVESYASSTGELVAWVKIPSLSSTEDMNIYLYYGNSSVASQENANGVWKDEYSGVWHLPNNINASSTDSTINQNNGIPYATASTTANGKIGGSFVFDGDSDYIDVPDDVMSEATTTVTAWMKADFVYGATKFVFGSNAGRRFYLGIEDPADIYARVYDSGVWGSYTIATSTWYYVSLVSKGNGDGEVFVNGVSAGTGGGTPNGIYEGINIGSYAEGNGNYWDGQIDEVRTYKGELSQAWLETEYNNQNNPELFFAVQAEEVGSAPVGYWSFDEGYGTTAHDESSGGNDGTITGATWQDESMCISGRCLYFDGDTDFVEVDMSGLENIFNTDATNITVNFWAKLNETVVSNNNVAVSMDGVFDFQLLSTSDRMEFWVDRDAGWYSSSDSIELIENQWYFFTGVWDGSTISLYRDGKLIETQSFSGSFLGAQQNLFIGSWYTGSTSYFNGYIDEVSIYPYVRSADQIRQDYNAGLSGFGSKKGIKAIFGGSSASWLSDGLVGYWKLDERTTVGGAIDASGKGNDGTYEGTASTTVGKFGRGVIFDGNSDYISLGNVSDLSFERTDAFSIAFWMKSTDNSASIISKMQQPSLAYAGYDIWNSDGYFNVNIRNYYQTNAIEVRTNEDISDGTWHHVAFSYDGSSQAKGVKVFVDGELKSSTITADTLTDSIINTSSVNFGSRNDFLSNLYNGLLDEIRIYNRELKESEVSKLYEWAPGPVLHLKMDEKIGTTIYDVSGYGNDGTFVNSPTWGNGKYGTAIDFGDVNDYINVGTTNDLALSVFSIGAWVKVPLSIPAGSTSVISRRNVSDANYLFQIYNDSHSYSGVVDFAYINPDNSVETATGTTDLRDMTWHYVVTQYDGVNQKIYIDGSLEKSETADVPDESGTQYFYLNHDYTVSDTGIPGMLIDDVRVYDYARTQKQILEDMNGGQSANNLTILDLSFDEGYGNTAYDASGNDNDASLVPGAYAITTMWARDGIKENCLAIPDSQRIEIPGLDVYDYYDFTISVWYKSDTSATPSSDRYIYWHTDGSDIINLSATEDTGHEKTVRINVRNGSNNYFYGTSDIVDQNWHHIVAMRRNGRVIIYVDGEEESNEDDNLSDGAISVDATNDAVAIGGSFSGSYIVGKLDEFKMWNYGLNSDEVKKTYNQSKTIVMGESKTANNNGTIVTGKNKNYCIPGDTTQCNPPILELKMDEKQGLTTYDVSGNGSSGTLQNGADWYTGKYGSGIATDGVNDSILVSTDGMSFNNQGGTISYWYKDRGTTASSFALGFDNNSTTNLALISYSSNGSTIRFFLGGNSAGDISVGTEMWDGDWHYFTVTWSPGESNTTVRYYVDAVETGSATVATDSITVNNWRISGYSDDTNGIYDEYRMYNYVRTPAQIAWDYNKGAPIAEWRFDECEGGVIHDESGNGYDGTLNLGISSVTATGTCASSSDSFWYNGRNGKYRSAGSFDGSNDYVNMGDISEMDNLSQFSMSAWMKRSSVSSPVNIGKYTINNGGTTITMWTNGYVYFDLYNGGSPTQWGRVTNNDTEWHHVMLVFDGTQSGNIDRLKGYIDGELQILDFQGTVQSTTFDGGDFKIGEVAGNYSDGLIDDVKIFNYALTEEQVKSVYNDGAVRF